MINKSLILMYIFLTIGCGNPKGVEKKFLLNLTEYNKVSFNGISGEKVDFKIYGKFNGSIKFAMIGSGNKLTERDFKIYNDSINLNIGQLKIYQDGTGFTWYVRPVNVTNGNVSVSMIEYRK